MITARQKIDELSDLIHTILPGLADASHGYALLDFPNYSNVGDSLIWLGELAYFERQTGLQPSYVCTTEGFDPAALKAALPEGPIFLSGGGNFGDIWPRFQSFRHDVLTAFKGRRIVQLPQTIHFASEVALAQTRDAIAEHGNFVMLVRDEASLSIACDALRCEAMLCPDMAFCLGPLERPTRPEHDVFLLLRTDKEKLASAGAFMAPSGVDCRVGDWIAPPPQAPFFGRALSKALRLVSPGADQDRSTAAARARQAYGMGLLGSGRSVITDRLHAHILSVLMGIPHAVLDNNYGKISGFVNAWTRDCDIVRLADSFNVAFSAVAEIETRTGAAS